MKHFIFKRPETFNNKRYMSPTSNDFYTIAAIRCDDIFSAVKCDILPAKSKSYAFYSDEGLTSETSVSILSFLRCRIYIFITKL